MNNSQLKAELDRANGALVDQLGAQPFIALCLTLQSSGKWFCGGAYPDIEMNSRISGEFCDTPEDAMKSIFEVIAALPSPEEAVTREYLSKVANAVDYATEHSIADEYVAPLRGVTCAMTDNLLSDQRGATQ